LAARRGNSGSPRAHLLRVAAHPSHRNVCAAELPVVRRAGDGECYCDRGAKFGRAGASRGVPHARTFHTRGPTAAGP